MPQPLPPFPWLDVAMVVALILLNGLFAMSELAIVSARKPRLEAMARRGSRGAAAAAVLAQDPARLLSTVQIGISLVSVFSGAYSGEKLGGPVAARLARLGLAPESAATLAFVGVIGLVTFVGLIIGELVPKQLALRRPEAVAAAAARPMQLLARLAAPLVWLLEHTSRLVLKLFPRGQRDERVTAEELNLVVAEASSSGVIEEAERQIISGVVRLADRPVRDVMTPRTEIEWIDADADEAELRPRLAALPHSRLLVAEGSVDRMLGVVTARDLLAALVRNEPLQLRPLLRSAPIVPDSVDAMDALDTLRRADVPLALVHDEYGHLEGIVTPVDLLSAIAGEFRSDQGDDEEPAIVTRADGSLLVSGWCAADALAQRLGLDLPEERDYATAAGLTLETLRHLPAVGESFVLDGWRFEVVDLDGRKIDKLLVSDAAA